MGDGIFKDWVSSFKPPDVSTPDSHRVCMSKPKGGSFCGRSSKQVVTEWAMCVCADCRAAGRADGLEVAVPEGARV